MASPRRRRRPGRPPKAAAGAIPVSERMLAVATRLFADRGFKAVSTREIAHRSGVTLSSLYHHFGDKRSLYVQAHMREFSKSSARLEAAIALGANERQRLLSFTIELLRVLSEPGPLLKLVARHWLDGDPAVVRYLAQATVPKQFGEVRAIIGNLVPQLNATAATLSLYSLAHGLVTLRQFEDSLPWQSGISREPHAMAVFVLGRMVPEVDWAAELARLDEPRAGLRAAGRVRRTARGAAP